MIKNSSFIIFFHELCVLIQTTNSRSTCFFLSSHTLKVGQEQILDTDCWLLELNRFVTLYVHMQNWFLISRNLCQGSYKRSAKMKKYLFLGMSVSKKSIKISKYCSSTVSSFDYFLPTDISRKNILLILAFLYRQLILRRCLLSKRQSNNCKRNLINSKYPLLRNSASSTFVGGLFNSCR